MPHGAVPFPFGRCRICNDKATGFHYGVATCEGCKGFYKRSIPKGDKYACFFGGECNITPFNRNRCKACRYRRCLDNGMAMDAVKMGRIPKLEKERALLEAGFRTAPSASNRDTDSESTDEDKSNFELDDRQWMQSVADHAQLSMFSMPSFEICPKSATHTFDGSPSQCGQSEIPQFKNHTLSALEWKEVYESKSIFYNTQELNADFGPTNQPSSYLPVQIPAWNGALESHGATDGQGEMRAFTAGIITSSSTTFSSSSVVLPDHRATFMSKESNVAAREFKDRFSAVLERKTCETVSVSGYNKCNSSMDETSKVNIQPLFCSYTTEFDNQTNNELLKCESRTRQSCTFCAQVDANLADNKINRLPQCAVLKETIVPLNSFEKNKRNLTLPGLANESLDISLGENTNNVLCTHHNTDDVVCSHHNTNDGLCSNQNSKYMSSLLGVNDLPGVNKHENQSRSQVSVYRKNLYSPDILRVLMNQVSADGLKGMKQQIMSYIDSGSVECGLVPRQLTFSTRSNSAADEIPRKKVLTQSPKSDTNHIFSSSEYEVIFATRSAYDFQHFNNLEEDLPLSRDIKSVGTICSSLEKYSQHDLTLEGIAHSTLVVPTCLSTDTLPPSKTQLFSQCLTESTLTVPGDNTQLKNHRSIDKFPLGAQELNIYEVDSICSQTEMDPIDTCLPDRELLGSVVGQILNEDFEICGEKLFTQAQSPESSNLLVSSLVAERSSPDSSCLADLTMSASASLLAAAYSRHMQELDLKHQRMLDFIHNKKVVPVHPLTCEGKQKVYDNLITSIPSINKYIIGFSMDVPGFMALAKEDRELLMKRSYYDIWMLTSSKLFYGDESYLQFADGTFYTRAWMETILNTFMVQKLVTFTKKLNSLGLSDLEMAILCAIQLTSASNGQLELLGHDYVAQMNSNFVDLLVQEVSRHRPHNCSRVLVDIFRLIPDLAEINKMQREIIASFSLNELPGKVEVQPEELPLADICEADLVALADN